ncbi:MFS transporter [Paenibacillus sp. LMG 31461]|uniref:MFS transporter n=1 Tax=Paenibacillus plantarum TaxID=2654975 RepID=A0ABX1XEV1_9BACL|nr:MFS transporter [Paenibacillus plantarum]NOU67012.1 MFS transporter [Paenibacillus plantarum]
MNVQMSMIQKDTQRPVVIISIITALCLLGDSMLYIVLPIYWKEVGLNALWEVGVLLSINRLVRLPMTPLIGLLYRKISLRKGLIFAVILAVVTTIGYGVFKGFLMWLILRSIWGIAWSFLRMGGYLSVINYSDKSNRGLLMGRYNGISRLGSLVGMLVGGVLVPLFGIQTVSIAFGLLIIAGIPFVSIYVANTKVNDSKDAEVQEKRIKQQVIWTKPVMKIISTSLIVNLMIAILSATVSLLIDTNYSKPLMFMGFVVTSTMLSGLLQAARWAWEPFLATWVGYRSDGPRGRIPIFILVLIGSAIGYALVPWHFPIYVWCGIILFIFANSTALSTLMDAMASDVARHSSVVTVMTVYSVAADVGSALGPMLIYLLMNLSHGMIYMYIGSALTFLLLALWQRPNLIAKFMIFTSGKSVRR